MHFEQYWKEHPDTWLIIIGGVGNLYDETLAHTRALRASDHIILIRAVTNPMPILKRCDLFLLSSYYEGQGIVLMEAATLGVPVMACDVSGCHSFLKKIRRAFAREFRGRTPGTACSYSLKAKYCH